MLISSKQSNDSSVSSGDMYKLFMRFDFPLELDPELVLRLENFSLRCRKFEDPNKDGAAPLESWSLW